MPEGSFTFDHAGKTYYFESGHLAHDGEEIDVNAIHLMASLVDTSELAIRELAWHIRNHPVEIDNARVAAADLSIPIVVSFHQGRWLILDGFHRFVKVYRMAKQMGVIRTTKLLVKILPAVPNRFESIMGEFVTRIIGEVQVDPERKRQFLDDALAVYRAAMVNHSRRKVA